MAIEATDFRATLAQWASGVAVATSVLDGQRVGITVSSFSSLSMEPPRILICIAKRLYTHQVISNSGVFAVNILAANQMDWGMLFAGRLPEQEDRFAGIETFTAETGAPLLPDVLGWLDCRVSALHDGGDHSIMVGDVVATSAQQAGEPLLYYHRNWRQLTDLA
jgi:flavin reductase (DIM6/NTAB) family NADH-FMN oxidoreductase RutF